MPPTKAIAPLEGNPQRSPRTDSHVKPVSYERTLARFDQPGVAENYPPAYGQSFREQREIRCVRHAIQSIAAGGEVLDLPCGTGRMIPILAQSGFHITAADASPRMVALAQRRWAETGDANFPAAGQVEFAVREILNTGFETNQFDGVICNRLFHHFNEAETRIGALRELGRICRGPIIVSFFNALALDALKFRLKHAWRKTTPTDRIPIPRRVFEADVKAAGLEVVARNAVMWGLSPLWYLTLRQKSR